MFRITIRRPSPALVVAALALSVALSGTAYAATTLPKNSVGTTQLKSGAVTLPKIAASAQGALKPRAWAQVGSDGTLVGSRGVSSTVVHHAAGSYQLSLNRPATKCPAIASVSLGGGGWVPGGIAQASVVNGTELDVFTMASNGGFSLEDESFNVVVYC